MIAYHQAQGGRDRGVVVGQDPVPTTARRQSDVLLQEVAVGAQAAWELWRFRGTLGVGPAFLRGEVQERTTFSLASQVFNPTRPGVVTTTRAGNGLGTWGAIGGTVAFGQSSLGVQLRRTWVRVPLGDGTADGGGLQAGALVVFRW